MGLELAPVARVEPVGTCRKCGAKLYNLGHFRLSSLDEWRELIVCASCEYARCEIPVSERGGKKE